MITQHMFHDHLLKLYSTFNINHTEDHKLDSSWLLAELHLGIVKFLKMLKSPISADFKCPWYNRPNPAEAGLNLGQIGYPFNRLY